MKTVDTVLFTLAWLKYVVRYNIQQSPEYPTFGYRYSVVSDIATRRYLQFCAARACVLAHAKFQSLIFLNKTSASCHTVYEILYLINLKYIDQFT